VTPPGNFSHNVGVILNNLQMTYDLRMAEKPLPASVRKEHRGKKNGWREMNVKGQDLTPSMQKLYRHFYERDWRVGRRRRSKSRSIWAVKPSLRSTAREIES
jgi:hypothetical protein